MWTWVLGTATTAEHPAMCLQRNRWSSVPNVNADWNVCEMPSITNALTHEHFVPSKNSQKLTHSDKFSQTPLDTDTSRMICSNFASQSCLQHRGPAEANYRWFASASPAFASSSLTFKTEPYEHKNEVYRFSRHETPFHKARNGGS